MVKPSFMPFYMKSVSKKSCDLHVRCILICLAFPPPNPCCGQDPHGELQGQNVLIVRYSVELTAAHFGISVEKVNELLASARAQMAEVRKSRPRPHLDSKMLASWNGNDCNGLQYTAHEQGLKRLSHNMRLLH